MLQIKGVHLRFCLSPAPVCSWEHSLACSPSVLEGFWQEWPCYLASQAGLGRMQEEAEGSVLPSACSVSDVVV